MKIRKILSLMAAVIVLFAVNGLLYSQQTTVDGKKILTLDDYTRWKRIVSTGISPGGEWISYGYRPNAADDTLHFKNINTGTQFTIPGGKNPAFSEAGDWAAFMIDLPKSKIEELRKAKKSVTRKSGYIDLSNGKKRTFGNTAGFIFARNTQYLAVKFAPANKDSKNSGSNLLLIDLQSGSESIIGNVSDYKFNKQGNYLAYTVKSDNKAGNGLYVVDLSTGVLTPIDTDTLIYSNIAWDEEGKRGIAALKGLENKKLTHRVNTLIVAFIPKNKKHDFDKTIYDPADDPNFPEGMVISENGALKWNNKNTLVSLGIRAQEEKLKKSAEKFADMDIWHWKDERIQSVQKRRAAREKKFVFGSVFYLDSKKFVRLADEEMNRITLSPDGRSGVGFDSRTYTGDENTDGRQTDIFAVNSENGERTFIDTGIRYQFGISPDSKHFLYWKDKQYHLYTFSSKKKTIISADVPVNFENAEFDRPTEKPPYGRGIAGWTKDGKSVVVSHKYDLWKLDLDGKNPVNITQGLGSSDEIQFRYIRLDPEEKSLDISKQMLLSAYGQWTKKAGFYSLNVGEKPKRLIYEDKSIGRPVKAKKAGRLLYTAGSFVDFPDYYVSGMDFSNPEKVTDANPQQSEYAWGRRILIDYTDSKGHKLQAALTLPAGYEQGKRYPMLVYFYEKMSQRLHSYSMPVYDDRPHMSTYASNGYLVLMPDIEYEMGRPGSSAVDCITSAVKKTVELGYADPDHVGLQGHSWGGYQSSYVITQTDIFAALVTGAPFINHFSFYNHIDDFNGAGVNEHRYYEFSQGRMGVPLYGNEELYMSQSPAHNVKNITTPFMILQGTDDGSCDWHQALEYYNACRRLGKSVIMLLYQGEPHHLRKLENQKDFLKRMMEFFDFHLKETPMPDWMEKGRTFLEKDALLKASQRK